jgi:hypothetical protein
MLLLYTLNPCTQTVAASNNTTFSTHSINIKCNKICVRKFGKPGPIVELHPNSYNLYILKPPYNAKI